MQTPIFYRQYKILSPAKINLFLYVTGKRPDGYHNLFSLMCCVGLYDTLQLSFCVDRIKLRCSDPNVPDDNTNLAYKAASVFFEKLAEDQGVMISIDKRIPVGAGLGGGSSNAAAVLLGLNRHFGCPFSQDELIFMGLSIGADIPFFIFRKPAIVTGIGEKLKPYNMLESFFVLIIYPGFGISTTKIYKELDLGLTNYKKKDRINVFNKTGFDVKSDLLNDLEAVAIPKYPEIKEAKDALISHGAKGALMSGSGSSVFGLFSDLDTAKRAMNAISQKNKWQLYLADLII